MIVVGPGISPNDEDIFSPKPCQHLIVPVATSLGNLTCAGAEKSLGKISRSPEPSVVKRFIITGLLFALLSLQRAAAVEAKPNIVLMVGVDLWYRDLGCYGATKIKTRRIDRFAREGVRFTHLEEIGQASKREAKSAKSPAPAASVSRASPP
jgi:hypothetical protein